MCLVIQLICHNPPTRKRSTAASSISIPRPGPTGTAMVPSDSIVTGFAMISRSIGFSQTLYSRKSDRDSTAFKCRLAAVNRSVSHACGQTSIPCALGLPDDTSGSGEASATTQVGLSDVDPPTLNQVAKAPRRCLLLTRGKTYLAAPAAFTAA